MTEAERQIILSRAKNFFRTRIAENHKENTEKLSSLSKFNVNPFTHKYLAQFAFGDSSPESMAKEANFVSWNGNDAKLDIRIWYPGHERCGKGVTLTEDEGRNLYEALKEIYEPE